MLDGKMGNFGAEKVKNHGFDWPQGYGGGGLVKAPQEKWGKMGEKWGEMGGNGGKWGNFGCSMKKWGIRGLKRSKNMVLIGNKAMGLWALGYLSRPEEGLTGPRVAPLGKPGEGAPHTPLSHAAGGRGTRLLVRSCMCCPSWEGGVLHWVGGMKT